jgi:hypothetical protein
LLSIMSHNGSRAGGGGRPTEIDAAERVKLEESRADADVELRSLPVSLHCGGWRVRTGGRKEEFVGLVFVWGKVAGRAHGARWGRKGKAGTG